MGTSTNSKAWSLPRVAAVAAPTGTLLYVITWILLGGTIPGSSFLSGVVIIYVLLPVFLGVLLQLLVDWEAPVSKRSALVIGGAGMGIPFLLNTIFLPHPIVLLLGIFRMVILALTVYFLSRALGRIARHGLSFSGNQAAIVVIAMLAVSVLATGVYVQQAYITDNPCEDTGVSLRAVTGLSPICYDCGHSANIQFDYKWTNGSLRIEHTGGPVITASHVYLEAGHSSVAVERLISGDNELTAGESITVSFIRRNESAELVWRKGGCEQVISDRTPDS